MPDIIHNLPTTPTIEDVSLLQHTVDQHQSELEAMSTLELRVDEHAGIIHNLPTTPTIEDMNILQQAFDQHHSELVHLQSSLETHIHS